MQTLCKTNSSATMKIYSKATEVKKCTCADWLNLVCLNEAACGRLTAAVLLYMAAIPATTGVRLKGGMGCTRAYLFQDLSDVILQI